MIYHELWQSLQGIYDERESRAVVLWLLEVAFGLSHTDVVCGAVEQLQDESRRQLIEMMARLQQGEPVQYVAGVADFGPRQFRVSPAVLIPRPETYELCQWIRGEWREERGERVISGKRREERGERIDSILDIGTGSGCIACTLASELRGSEVTAWDISEEALYMAKENAKNNGSIVVFEQQDALSPPDDHNRWDIIVSNPPYICDKESDDMQRNVLDYEPHLALFVPDNDPLCFYRAIGQYAHKALKTGGRLFFELNAAYADETKTLMEQLGFTNTEIKDDQFGRHRFLKTSRP